MTINTSRPTPRPRLALLAAGIALVLPALVRAEAGTPAAPQGVALTVNSLADNITAGDGLVTLREAIIAANTDGTTDLGQTASGADLLDLSLLSGTIALANPLPPILSDITVFGPGADLLAISGDSGTGQRSRHFFIDGGDLTVVGVELSNGFARGGDGGTCEQRTGCGGGGGGMGGTVFLDSGSLALLSVRIRDSEAGGGAGGARSLPAGFFGGGGGGGIYLAGSGPGAPSGGAGADGVPLNGLGGTPGGGGLPGGSGGSGAGGGGGTSSQIENAPGGAGGFGGGGGGAGYGFGSGGSTPTGGEGGFGGGGGGRGCRTAATDGPGASGGAFGGTGGASSGGCNFGGGGGGGAGLGGAIFARAGSIDLQDVLFSNNQALRGPGGGHFNSPGTPGQGKGGALFILPGATLTASAVSFAGNGAADGSGTGFVPGQAVDTNDVYGVIADIDRVFAYGFE
jgi:hypothetical protein